MTQKKYNIKLLEPYLKAHPKASNDDLYEECNAITDSQKGSVRKKKNRILKKNVSGSPGEMQTLSSEDLEKRIVNALNRHPDNAQILGKAIEFFIKIKGKTETISDTIDMEVLRQIGINIKGSN